MVEVSLHGSLGLHVGKEVPTGYLGLTVAIRNPLLLGLGINLSESVCMTLNEEPCGDLWENLGSGIYCLRKVGLRAIKRTNWGPERKMPQLLGELAVFSGDQLLAPMSASGIPILGVLMPSLASEGTCMHAHIHIHIHMYIHN